MEINGLIFVVNQKTGKCRLHLLVAVIFLELKQTWWW